MAHAQIPVCAALMTLRGDAANPALTANRPNPVSRTVRRYCLLLRSKALPFVLVSCIFIFTLCLEGDYTSSNINCIFVILSVEKLKSFPFAIGNRHNK